MDLGAILSAVLIALTGVGGWVRGRSEGTALALQHASDTVGMLSVQLALKEARIAELTRSLEALERHHQECNGGGSGNGEGGPAHPGPPDDRRDG